jgi:ubiquinone/menaquinone biosynthesis C-methylase UbiE
VDFSPDVVAEGQRQLKKLVAQGRLTLLVADVTDLPLRDALVHKVVTTNTVYFWPDLVAGFRSIRRVMAPEGEISVGFSGKAKMEEFGGITEHGFEKPDAEEVCAAMARAGLLDARAHALAGRRTQGDFVVVARKR